MIIYCWRRWGWWRQRWWYPSIWWQFAAFKFVRRTPRGQQYLKGPRDSPFAPLAGNHYGRYLISGIPRTHEVYPSNRLQLNSKRTTIMCVSLCRVSWGPFKTCPRDPLHLSRQLEWVPGTTSTREPFAAFQYICWAPRGQQHLKSALWILNLFSGIRCPRTHEGCRGIPSDWTSSRLPSYVIVCVRCHEDIFKNFPRTPSTCLPCDNLTFTMVIFAQSGNRRRSLGHPWRVLRNPDIG